MSGKSQLKTRRFLWLVIVICVVAIMAINLAFKKKLKTNSNQPGSHIITVQSKQEQTVLKFITTLAPKSIVNVSSRIDGVVKRRLFSYGQKVKQGDLLLTLTSDQLTKDYQETLSSYLSAKEQFQQQQASWQGTQELYKLGLEAEDKYRTEKRSFFEKRFQYYQKRKQITEIIKKTVDDKNSEKLAFDKLDYTDAKHLLEVLNEAHNELQVFSPATGSVMYPIEKGETKDTTPLIEGDPIKAKDVLVSIADMTGFSLSVSVNEMNILKLKKGQKVEVSGHAFADRTLRGVVDSLDKQGSQGSGGLPMFQVHIIVPNLTEVDRQRVLVGMSAEVSIKITSQTSLSVPFKAIVKRASKTGVMRVNAKGQASWTQVQTGSTQTNSVSITRGLKAGDKIVVPD